MHTLAGNFGIGALNVIDEMVFKDALEDTCIGGTSRKKLTKGSQSKPQTHKLKFARFRQKSLE